MTPSPLTLVWIVAPVLVAALGALLCLILGLFYVIYLQPLLDWATRPGGGFFKRLVFWPVRKATEAVRTFARTHVATLVRSYVTGIEPLVFAMGQTTAIVNRVAGTLGDMAEQTHLALWTLRHETVPRLITAALVPIRAQLARHTDRLDAIEDLNQRVAAVVGSGLRTLPWGVPGSYVGNFQSWWNSYEHLWEQFFGIARPQLQRLATETVPELARDLADLARRIDVQIDARFDALGSRIGRVEDAIDGAVGNRLAALEAAVDTLAAEIFQGAGEGLLALLVRIIALEQAVEEAIPGRFQEVEQALQTLRDELAEGIRVGVTVFTERLETVERAVTATLPARLDALELGVDALAAEVFQGIGTGFTALMERITELERRLSDLDIPQLDLVLGRIEALEQQLTNDVLPRLRGIEDLLVPAAFAALVLATLRNVAPNLFCRNVTTATQRICGIDENLFAQLLAGTLLFALALDPRVIARAGQEVTGGMVGLFREIALR